MGLFDLPTPVLAAADGWLATFLSSILRLWFWGIVGGAASMGLYWLLSPQKRIGENKRQLAEAQRTLNQFDGEFADAAPLMKRMLGLAFKQVGIVVFPALVAMLPVLCLLAWMSTVYTHHWPTAGTTIDGQTVPEGFSARWRSGEASATVDVRDGSGASLFEKHIEVPVTILHKRRWWNVLLGNPAGYLPDELPLQTVEFELPRIEYLGVGPAWLRGWEFSFLLAVFVGALGLKLGFRIE